MKTPLKHQIEGIAFLVNGGSLLADDMGLGKTFQACMAAEQLPRKELPILVICPAVIIGGWMAELGEVTGREPFWLHSGNIGVLRAGQDVVVSVDLVARSEAIADLLRKRRWRVLIVDEAHYLGNDQSARTRAILLGRGAISDSALRTFLLTGTPTRKHVGQLWPLIAGTEHSRIKFLTKEQFEGRYCTFKDMKVDGKRIRTANGNRKPFIPELRGRLKGWWLRRRKDDPELGLNLPPKNRRVVPVMLDDLSVIRQLETSEEGRALKSALECRDMRLADDDDHSLSRMLRLMGMMKAQKAVSYCQHLLDDKDARGVVLWFQHLDAMGLAEAALKREKLRYRRIDGSTPAAKRTEIEGLMQAGKLDVVLGQISAAGVGLTMTHANHAVFAEAQWIPTPNVQAEDRIYRIGQDSEVWCHYLAVYGSIDMVLQRVIQRRIAEWEYLDPSIKRG